MIAADVHQCNARHRGALRELRHEVVNGGHMHACAGVNGGHMHACVKVHFSRLSATFARLGQDRRSSTRVADEADRHMLVHVSVVELDVTGSIVVVDACNCARIHAFVPDARRCHRSSMYTTARSILSAALEFAGAKWHTLKTFAGRVFALGWLFARLLLIGSYTANLASTFITDSLASYQVESIPDAIARN